jgi:hypothetical protein
MKKIALLALAGMIGFGLNSFSQEDPDTSKIRIGNKKYTVIIDNDKEIRILTDEDSDVVVKDRRDFHHHKPGRKMDGTWGGFELGVANLTNANYKLELPANAGFLDYKMNQSYGFNFNFAEKSLGIIRNYFGLVTGLGFEYQQFMLANNINLTKTDDGITGEPINIDLNKNRFSMCYLTLPLMAEFQIPVYGESHRIKLSAGVIGGLRLGSRQVQKYESNGEKEKIKTKDDFYLRDFRYGFTARVGYGDVAVFATYYPQTLFETGKGPQIFPVTFGLHFGA